MSKWSAGSTCLTTTYGYDAGKLVSTSYNDNLTPNVGYSYDAFGRQSAVTQQGNSWTYSYDPANLRLTSETITYDTDGDGSGDFTRTLDRSRDALLRSTGYQFKNGSTVETDAAYTYDDAGRLATVAGGDVSSPQSFSYAYEPGSLNLIHSVTGPVHTVTNTWEATRDVLATKENKVGTNVISRYGYTVNEIGQRTALATSGSAFAVPPSLQWAYNARGEVTSAAHSDSAQSRFYEFDAIGNRRKSREGSATDSGGTLINYTANSLNQYSAIDSRIPTHDADGNQLTGILAVDPTKTAGYTWDGENRLIEAKADGNTVGVYQYDPFGRRIHKNGIDGQRWFIYDGWNLITENLSGNLLRSHLWGRDLSGDLQGAGGVGGLLCTHISGNPYCPAYDGNGNAVQYLDSIGSIVANFKYDAFGAVTAFQGSMWDFNLRFSTKYEDFETGLNYYGYRYYDSQQGRWISKDPINEIGGDLYFVYINIIFDILEKVKSSISNLEDSGRASQNELIDDLYSKIKNSIEIGEVDDWINLFMFTKNDPASKYDFLGLNDKPKRNLDCEGFNKNSNPGDVARALEEAKRQNNKNRAKALKALLKVIKRGGRFLVPLGPFIDSFEQSFGPIFPQEPVYPVG